MSDTPRTDAQEWKATAEKSDTDQYFDVVYAEFARGLEREAVEAGKIVSRTVAALRAGLPPLGVAEAADEQHLSLIARRGRRCA